MQCRSEKYFLDWSFVCNRDVSYRNPDILSTIMMYYILKFHYFPKITMNLKGEDNDHNVFSRDRD